MALQDVLVDLHPVDLNLENCVPFIYFSGILISDFVIIGFMI